jgi:integrase/recombinase XerD
MPRAAGAPILELPFKAWAPADQMLWDAALRAPDNPFEASGAASHLAEATRRSLRSSYGIWLGFLSAKNRARLIRSPSERLDRELAIEYVAWRRRTCGARALAADLNRLRHAMTYLCPGPDLSWLQSIAKRLAIQAPPKSEPAHRATSDQLYALGMKLMDDADEKDVVRKFDAFQYRDGLIIALLALIPLRRRTLTSLRIGQHLLKSGERWVLDIPAQDTKTGRSLDYPVSENLSARIDRYLAKFRGVIPGASKHDGLWASNQSRPMDDGAIYDRVQRRTRETFGFAVNLHHFRHAAATFWSIHDPGNVRGAKDLLGHSSFGTTEKHYIMAQSRLAGRALARAIGGTRGNECCATDRHRS